MTAREALERARLTAACAGEGLLVGCAFQYMSPAGSPTVADEDIYSWSVAEVHRWHASLELDGFDVGAVTAAERELEL